MITVTEILGQLNQLAPMERKMDFDNVGFLVGHADHPVTAVMCSLDITEEVISEAKENGCQLIVSHHPVIFHPVKAVTDRNVPGKRLLGLIENNIAAICMHTNLDAADRGVNAALADALSLQEPELLTIEGTDSDGIAYCCGRAGTLSLPETMRDFLAHVKQALNADGLRYHDAGKTVSRVAVVGGSGGSYLQAAIEAGCDTLVTADIKYDVFLDAAAMGINLIDADHFCTENTVVPVLCGFLTAVFPELKVFISQNHGQTAKTYK